jgi:rhodanese-related sulfurtransferase
MVHSVTAVQAYELLARGEVEVVDVREPAEWSVGHIPGARLVPLEQIRATPKAVLPRDGVIFVCASGMRSQTAARFATQAGHATIYNLSGGTRAWISAGLPIEQGLSKSA